MASYSSLSPYYSTSQSNGYLDVANMRTVPAEADDVVYTLTKTYEHRPDLLAYDVYGDVGLWWVFAARNPNTIQDPIFDMIAGTQIFLPKESSLKTALGN
jgi:hypothetical protein